MCFEELALRLIYASAKIAEDSFTNLYRDWYFLNTS